jgi:hypothetical protein
LSGLQISFGKQDSFIDLKEFKDLKKTGDYTGAGQISSGTPLCRINAAFHHATERRIYAAAKNSVVRPDYTVYSANGREC